MAELALIQCLGLDTRPDWGDDEFSLASCSNIQVRPGGSIDTRPALVEIASVSALSSGLYSRGGSLRCLVPSGLSLQGSAPAGFTYDGIGDASTTAYSGKIGAVIGAETYGFDPIAGPHGYVAFRRLDTEVIEHHWIKAPPASYATYANTKVVLPFQPGPGMIKHANKILTTDPVNGYLRYCSSVNGPDDWTTAGDAGFELARQFIAGQRDMIGVGIHRGLVAIFYADAVQLWSINTDPADNGLQQVLNGPGTDFATSIANVLGDGFFLSRSGFANLENALVTGESKFGDIGSKVQSLTSSIATTDKPISIWAHRRGQFLCFVGTRVYCYSIYPKDQETAWTTWTLPVSVTDACEQNGVVYVRAGDTVYKLDDTTGTDYDGTDIVWSLRTSPFGMGVSTRYKSLRRITAQCTGRATYTPVADGRSLDLNAVTMPGNSGTRGAMLLGRGRRFALRVNGTGRMSFYGAELSAEVAGT